MAETTPNGTLEGVQAEVGTVPEEKIVYKTQSPHCTCCTVWIDECPKDEHDPERHKMAEKARAKYAIIRRQDRHGPGFWKTDSIAINSAIIRAALVDVFSDYPTVDAHAVALTFDAPFIPFVHRWEQLKGIRDDTNDEKVREHLSSLLTALGPDTEDAFLRLKNIQDTGYVRFDDLTLAFVCGETILHCDDGVLSAGILRDVDIKECMGTRICSFAAEVVDWNGKEFGLKTETWSLQTYSGSQQLVALDVHPLRIREDRETIESLLVDRGRSLEQFQGQHFRQYTGKAAINHRCKFIPMCERVVVDARSYYDLQSQMAPSMRPLSVLESSYKQPEDDSCLSRQARPRERRPRRRNTRPPPPAYSGGNHTPLGLLTNEFLAAAFSSLEYLRNSGGSDGRQTLSETARMLAVPWVRGFAIDSKIWCKGIVFLLSGAPGVGKTLTAESVAEHLERPLYRLGAADLGISVDTVETRLNEALARCTAWNAILLIDEADVFLEARGAENLQRNELISIFLRLLEYYKGILILTTNRVSTIDRAFESRIDIALNYPDLDLAGRVQVLQNMLRTLPPETTMVDGAELEDLMRKPLNGRHIKSAVKTALILAASEGRKISKKHLQLVLELREKSFEMDLSK